MSGTPTAPPSRGEMLRRLREAHAATVERTQALFREQKAMQQAICQAILHASRTVPEIAAEIGKPAHEVLWLLAAMKKYGIVEEAGMSGDYPRYQLPKQVQA